MDLVVSYAVAGEFRCANSAGSDLGGESSGACAGNIAGQSNSLIAGVGAAGRTGMRTTKGAVLSRKSPKAEGYSLGCGIDIINKCAACSGAGDFLDVTCAGTNTSQDDVGGSCVLDLGVCNRVVGDLVCFNCTGAKLSSVDAQVCNQVSGKLLCIKVELGNCY